jgi:hypothetical protein
LTSVLRALASSCGKTHVYRVNTNTHQYT